MTAKKSATGKEKYFKFIYNVVNPLLSALLLLIFIKNSDTVREDIYNSLMFLSKRLIPTLFPFAILTQILIKQNIKIPFSEYICNLLGIQREVLTPLVLGVICGFPIGAILIREHYKRGIVERHQAEKAIIISSQPSIAFLLMISKKNGSLFFGNKILFASILLVLCFLVLSKKKHTEREYTNVITRQNLRLADCIRASGEAMINLSFFVIAFSAVGSIIKSTLKNPMLIAHILPFFEITTAINYISTSNINDKIKLFLIPFSIGFSGLCVFMQIKSILSDTDLSIKKYIPVKLLQGILLGAIIYTINI